MPKPGNASSPFDLSEASTWSDVDLAALLRLIATAPGSGLSPAILSDGEGRSPNAGGTAHADLGAGPDEPNADHGSRPTLPFTDEELDAMIERLRESMPEVGDSMIAALAGFLPRAEMGDPLGKAFEVVTARSLAGLELPAIGLAPLDPPLDLIG